MTTYRRTKINYRKIYKEFYGEIPIDYDTGKRCDIHHIDGDTENNDISNLIALTRKEHYLVHYEQGDFDACLRMSGGLKLTPDEISQLISDIWTPERRESQRRLQIERMKDPVYRSNIFDNPLRLEKLREAHLKLWENNDIRRKEYSELIKNRMNDPIWKEQWLKIIRTEEYRENQRINRLKYLSDPNHIQQISDKSKEMWLDPQYREIQRQHLLNRYKDDPESKQKFIESCKRANSDKEEQQRRRKLQRITMSDSLYDTYKRNKSTRFTELNNKRNEIPRECPYCLKQGKGPGFTNHIRKCEKLINSRLKPLCP